MTRRNEEVWLDGVLVETKTFDVTWEDVRNERNTYLEVTDLWMLSDRFNQLTLAQQSELTTYRQTLRDITTHDTANEAYDAIPDPPTWA
tara:strand:+ start:5600 stop:5866 length:267 start_codon:yes stop_codon:yes gene_type:complete